MPVNGKTSENSPSFILPVAGEREGADTTGLKMEVEIKCWLLT
jgi:hypothetical protein